jgi:hypothetical protein
MAGQTDHQTPQAGTPVPDLIERYRLRRDAWIAQADELARLRDEVRGSAEREAMEIVTAARRDVRKVIMEARRELLVLSAQVQAALGEATAKTDPATLLNKAGFTPDAAGHLPAAAPDTFAAENAVNEILNEVQDEMTALAADARALPLQNVPPVRQISAPPVQQPTVITPPPSRPQPTPAAPSVPSSTLIRPADITTQVVSPEELELDVPELSESASQTLLSSQFPSDAVPVQNGRRFRMFIALFVGVGLTVAAVTIWWLSNRGTSQPESVAASATTATSNGRPAASGALAPGDGDKVVTPRATSGSSNLLLVAEAVRDVWVRTTVDGRTDEGRTLAAGQSMDVSAEQSISIRVGDAGAVVVSVNNGEKRPLGRDGQVVTRQFVVEGPKTPARPAAPQSAEPTPAPSGNTRTAPPVAAAPPLPPPFPTSSGTPTQAAAPPMPAPQPVSAPTSIAPPLTQAAARPPVSQPAANTSQPSAPSGIVNQLSATASPSPAPNASAAVTPASPATTVVAIARQWLEAYHRQDRAAMAALSTDNLLLADERRADERFPPGLSDVTRTLDRVSVQIAADTAVLTAVMMEQSGSSPATPHVSPISQVWVLGGGQWKVRQARFVSEARLNQVFK